MLKYKKNPTLSQGGIDIGLKVGILAEIGYMLHECALLYYHFRKIVTVSHFRLVFFIVSKEIIDSTN